MRSFYRLGVVLVGLFLLLMTSCIDSEKPLSDPKEAKPVKELLGVWRVSDGQGGTQYYHVGLAGDKFPAGMMQVAIVDHRKDGRIESDSNVFFAFATTLGDRHFLNISTLEPDKLKEAAKTGWKPEMFQGYWIFEYKLAGENISFSRMDGNRKESLIKSQKIKGTIERSKNLFGDQIYFTDSSENLAKVITSPDADKLFQPTGKEGFERVK